MKHAILTLALTLAFAAAFAQSGHEEEIRQAFGNEGEICFTFNIDDHSEANVLTKIVSIDRITGNEVFAYANRKEFAAFLKLGIPYTLVPHPSTMMDESELRMGQAGDGPKTEWNFYPTYEQYVAYMQGFAADHPEICRLDTIGETVEGRLLLIVKISDSVGQRDGEPEFLYTSSMHGDEVTGYVLMMHLIDYLLTNYGTDPRITNMVDSTEIFICPLANPDGTYHGGNGTVWGAQRYNANYIDLNRNYPDPADGPHPDGEDWQPETVAFMALADSNHFAMGANFHGGASVLNYPWDTWSKLTADDDWWQFVCREYVDTVQLYGPAWYYSQFDNGITNGYQWYRITGGRQDYMNYWHFCREVTNEISDTKTPSASQLLNYWEWNYRSLLNYIEEVNCGAQGFVTDSLSGEPLEAKAYIFQHDKDNSQVYSKLPSGYYSRLLYEGAYNISFSCDGYHSKLVNGVNIVNRTRTPLDVQLVPLTFGTGHEGTQRTAMACPNPSDGRFRIILPVVSQESLTIEVFDITGDRVYRTAISGTAPAVQMDLSHLAPGLYLIRLSSEQGLFEDRVILY